MINKWIGIGNVTKDPDLKEIGSGTVCNFGIACNER
jgi:single-stranded DNA-binding protein